jgi:hypothetical protein
MCLRVSGSFLGFGRQLLYLDVVSKLLVQQALKQTFLVLFVFIVAHDSPKERGLF